MVSLMDGSDVCPENGDTNKTGARKLVMERSHGAGIKDIIFPRCYMGQFKKFGRNNFFFSSINIGPLIGPKNSKNDVTLSVKCQNLH